MTYKKTIDINYKPVLFVNDISTLLVNTDL